MSTQHQEFPPLAPESEAILREAYQVLGGRDSADWRRAYLSAGIREAMRQAGADRHGPHNWNFLGAIADNLHAPPPAPPTREQMEQALQNLLRRTDDPAGCHEGSLVAEWADTIRRGIAHHCKVQP